jgi:hypothetical protein
LEKKPTNQRHLLFIAFGLHNVAVRGDGSPHFTVQPWNGAISSRGTLILCGKAVGSFPMFYQWQLNGRDIEGATTDSLTLTNPSASARDSYRLLVNNAHGNAASSPAIVKIIPLQFDRSAAQFSNNTFFSQVIGASGFGNVVILSSTNLTGWVPVITNPPTTSVIEFRHQAKTNQDFQFYKVLER